MSKIGSEQNQKLTINPVTYGLGKIQEALGESEALPLVGSIVGRTILPIPGLGAAGGAMVGEKLRQMNKKGGLEAFMPDLEGDRAVGNKGLVYGGADLLFTGIGKALPKIFNPVKSTGALKDEIVKQTTKTFSGDKLVSAMKEYIKNDPYAKPVVEKLVKSLAGKEITAEELMKKLPIWNKAYGAAGQVGDSAKKGVYDILSKTARNLMKSEAPELSAAYSQWARAYGHSVAMKKIFNVTNIARTAIGTGIGTVVGIGVGKAMSGGQR